MSTEPHNAAPAVPSRNFTLALQGAGIGLVAGCAGAWAMNVAFEALPLSVMAVVAFVPMLTGFCSGLFGKTTPNTPFSPYSGQIPRISSENSAFSGGLVHMGSRLGLSAFLLRFGISRGFFHQIAENTENTSGPTLAEASIETQQNILDLFEKQHSTVTAISYDSQTNRPTSDTMGRDRLASARLALLSMDHTKQIPH